MPDGGRDCSLSLAIPKRGYFYSPYESRRFTLDRQPRGFITTVGALASPTVGRRVQSRVTTAGHANGSQRTFFSATERAKTERRRCRSLFSRYEGQSERRYSVERAPQGGDRLLRQHRSRKPDETHSPQYRTECRGSIRSIRFVRPGGVSQA